MKGSLISLFFSILTVSSLPLPKNTTLSTGNSTTRDEVVETPRLFPEFETLIQVPGLLVNSTCPDVETLTFTAVDAKPWPLVAGQNANFYLNGTSSSTVYPGSIISLAIGIVTEDESIQDIYAETFDVCGLLGQFFNISCPVGPSDFYLPLSLSIPKLPLPNVTLILDAQAINGDPLESTIGCLRAVVSLDDLPIVKATNATLPVSPKGTLPVNINITSIFA